jgi:protease YdgD
MTMRVLLILIITILAAFTGWAKGHELLPADINNYPWSSIGKLYNRAGGACTGAIASLTEVVTAAHCLYNPRTSILLQPESLHFLIGYKQGEYREDLRVSKFTVGPNYRLDSTMTVTSETSDWAILKLRLPVAAGVKPLSLSNRPPKIGDRIMVGGFAQSQRYSMTADTKCGVRAILSNGLLVHDCAVMKGDSGAPLMRSNGDMIEVLGVHVGTALSNGVALRIAVPAINLVGSAD